MPPANINLFCFFLFIIKKPRLLFYIFFIAFGRMTTTPHHKSEHKSFPDGHCQLIKNRFCLRSPDFPPPAPEPAGGASNGSCQPGQSTYLHVRFSLLLFSSILKVLLNAQHTHGSCSFPDGVCSESLVQDKNLVLVLF